MAGYGGSEHAGPDAEALVASGAVPHMELGPETGASPRLAGEADNDGSARWAIPRSPRRVLVNL